jgi:uncharacterized protein (TIGR03118 family)
MRCLRTCAAHAAILTVSILGTAVAGLAAGFNEIDLIANKPSLTDSNGVVHTPKRADPNLVNPWGLTASSTSPFWVADNGAGVSTLYPVHETTVGTNALVVPIPTPTNPTPTCTIPPTAVCGTPTGVVFNIVTNTTAPLTFPITGVNSMGVTTTLSARFIFATEDGTIIGWNPAIGPDKTHLGFGIIAVNNSANPSVGNGAVYKGLAIATDSTVTPAKTLLYVTNFRAGTVEVYDTTFTRVVTPGAFSDVNLPRGYAPFNIVPVQGKMVVTFAVQDAARHDDVASESHGIVDTFDLKGLSLHRLVQHGQLNSPWGVAVAPANFGALAGALLIGNFGNGHIDAYNPTTGEFIDKMRDPHGKMLSIDGLWSLRVGSSVADTSTTTDNNFGPDTVYFTAGTNGEQDGLFGALQPN